MSTNEFAFNGCLAKILWTSTHKQTKSIFSRQLILCYELTMKMSLTERQFHRMVIALYNVIKDFSVAAFDFCCPFPRNKHECLCILLANRRIFSTNARHMVLETIFFSVVSKENWLNLTELDWPFHMWHPKLLKKNI